MPSLLIVLLAGLRRGCIKVKIHPTVKGRDQEGAFAASPEGCQPLEKRMYCLTKLDAYRIEAHLAICEVLQSAALTYPRLCFLSTI